MPCELLDVVSAAITSGATIASDKPPANVGVANASTAHVVIIVFFILKAFIGRKFITMPRHIILVVMVNYCVKYDLLRRKTAQKWCADTTGGCAAGPINPLPMSSVAGLRALR